MTYRPLPRQLVGALGRSLVYSGSAPNQAIALPTAASALGFRAPGADLTARCGWMVTNMGSKPGLTAPDNFVFQIQFKPLAGLVDGTWGNEIWFGESGGSNYMTLALNESGVSRYRPYIEASTGIAAHAASVVLTPGAWCTLAVRFMKSTNAWDKVSLWLNGTKLALDHNDGTEGNTNWDASAVAASAYFDFFAVGNPDVVFGSPAASWADSRGSYRKLIYIPSALNDTQMANLASGSLTPLAAGAKLHIEMNGISDLTNLIAPGTGNFLAFGAGGNAPVTDPSGP